LNATQKLLRFGVYELNLTTEELRQAGTLVKLPQQPFRTSIRLRRGLSPPSCRTCSAHTN